MRAWSIIAAIGICSILSARCLSAAAPSKATNVRSARQSSSAQAAGYWCRTPDGRWLWITGTKTLPNGQTAYRTYSYYRPQVTIIGEDGRPAVVGGIDWYLNGRGPFSD